jgi:hypothetical protein
MAMKYVYFFKKPILEVELELKFFNNSLQPNQFC